MCGCASCQGRNTQIIGRNTEIIGLKADLAALDKDLTEELQRKAALAKSRPEEPKMKAYADLTKAGLATNQIECARADLQTQLDGLKAECDKCLDLIAARRAQVQVTQDTFHTSGWISRSG